MVDRALADMDFLDRIEREFNIEDMTQIRLEEWLYHGEIGKHQVKWGFRNGKQRYKEVEGKPISTKTRRLAEELSEVKEVYEDIDKLDIRNLDIYFENYNKLQDRISELPVIHEDKITDKIKPIEEVLKKIGGIIEDISTELVEEGKIKSVITDLETYNLLPGREKALISNRLRRNI